MKIERSKEWWLKRADEEGDAPVAAGSLDVVKGSAFGGPCARTACDHVDAVWWNTSTRRWYCGTCAHRINDYAPAAICVRSIDGSEAA